MSALREHRRQVGEGRPEPLGASLVHGGLNVAVASAHATRIEVAVYDETGFVERERIALPGRTGDVHHGLIAGLGPGTRYGLRADGPFDPARGQRFNAAKLLVDPYATALDRPFVLDPAMFDRPPAAPGLAVSRDDVDSGPFVPKAIVAAAGPVAAAQPAAPRPPRRSDVVYELHVRGFTRRHPAVPEAIRGTMAGLAHPAAIEHLVRLGVGTVELMPLAAWIDERHLVRLGLSNYWGYNPVAMLAPDPRLAPGGMAEVAASVAALKAAGFEVILDVVLNHTGEGDALGPTVSLRGLDATTYYRHARENPGRLVDDTGCGNTLALDRPAMLRLAMDTLRHWALAAGVDGFRFDLGATLGRRDDGFDPDAPLFQAIEQDPLLRTKRIVAEPWDVGPGGYRLGGLPVRWGEWNDRYRDAVRCFWRGDGGRAGELATRLAGSSDVFAARHRRPSASVNFLAAHDGFTLADLVAYETKHNAANGEENRDGHGDNHSWNHGVEGPSDDPAIAAARAGDVRALILTLIASRGTPMLAMGDELGRSQHGNNNAYAQDNETAWLDWDGGDDGLAGFVARLVAARAAHPALHRDRFLSGGPVDDSGIPDVEWRTAEGGPLTSADWATTQGLVVALYAPAEAGAAADHVVVVLNAGSEPMNVVLPDAAAGWRLVADSAAPERTADLEAMSRLAVAGRSAVLLVEGGAGTAAAVASPRRHGTDVAALDRLAAAAGIAPEWWGLAGDRHIVSTETKLALLAGMGLAAASTGEARDNLARLAERRERRLLPSVVVAREGEAVEVPVASGEAPPPRVLLVEAADGALTPVHVARDAPVETVVAADGRTVARRLVPLPELPAGEHRLSSEDGEIFCRLIVSPGRAFVPTLLAGGREVGLAAHLYAVRRGGDAGIGDFTALAHLAELAGRAGAATLGLNPLHALFPADRLRASPYHPSDRRFLDPIYLDLAAVPDAVPVAAADASLLVDYPGVWAAKAAALEAAFAAFRRRPVDDGLVAERARFVAAGGEALRRFAVFAALAETHPGTAWWHWPEGLREAGSAATAAFAAAHADRVAFHLHLQWLADRQLGAAAAAGRAAGLAVGLYRDLAVGCAPDGAEAWASDGGLATGASIGAPPDAFTSEGQIWNLPPPDPNRMAETGYAAFDALLAANMRHAGALRIDHAMALTRLFWVPQGARALDGAYVRYPLEDLLGVLALRSREARCLVIGEDLGVVPEGFRERLDAHAVMSYRVVGFERDGDGYVPAGRYPERAVACVSSHDLPPLDGWWAGHDLETEVELGRLAPAELPAARVHRAEERAALAAAVDAAGAGPLDPDAPAGPAVVDAVHGFLARTPCRLAMLQLDDLTGETEPLNVPGTDGERPNWRRRLSATLEEIADGPIPDRIAAVVAERREPPAGG